MWIYRNAFAMRGKKVWQTRSQIETPTRGRDAINKHTYPAISFVRSAWCMPLPRSKASHQDDLNIEEIIQEGCRIMSLQAKPHNSYTNSTFSVDNRLGGVGHCFTWQDTCPFRVLVLVCWNIDGVINQFKIMEQNWNKMHVSLEEWFVGN